MTTNTNYNSIASNFHGARTVGSYDSLHEALTHLGCGRECECGGGHVEVDGRAIDLNQLPDDVLMGREPTASELAAAI
jgi:hypothetical protein